jgi:protein-disulfide isomerase
MTDTGGVTRPAKPLWRTVGRLVDRGTIVLMGLAAVAFLWLVAIPAIARLIHSRAGIRVPTNPISLDGAAVRGASAARVILIEFADYECTFCAQFEQDSMPVLSREYVDSGKIKVAFRNLPLKIHPRAVPAARAADCARQQGKFWPFHALLFEVGAKLDDVSLQSYAKRTDLDQSAFDACLGSQSAGAVERDVEAAKSIGFHGTPSFLIGQLQADGRVRGITALRGARPVQDFRRALDDAIARQR